MAAKFCSQCGHEVSSTAKFCPNCAAPLTANAPGPSLTTHPLDTAARKSRSLLLPAALAAVVLLTIAVAVLAGSRKQASLLASAPPDAQTAPAVTNTPPPAPLAAPPLTNSPSQPPLTGPAVTNTPDHPAPALPPDVAAYLKFLGEIEQKRIALNNDTTGANAMLGIAQGMQGQGGMPTGDPGEAEPGNPQDGAKQNTQKLSQGYSDYALKWQALVREFRAAPPPPACTGLASRYLAFLSDYTTLITKLQVALLNHDSSGLPDLSAVSTVQATVNTDGAAADTALSDLCARYSAPKPFVIAPESAAPSLLGH